MRLKFCLRKILHGKRPIHASQAISASRDQAEFARILGAISFSMLPPFCCNGSSDHHKRIRQHQERKMAMLTFWRDGLERQLAALNATIGTLHEQMERDA